MNETTRDNLYKQAFALLAEMQAILLAARAKHEQQLERRAA
jgi:hypothetical protein